jgi:hypothetical protein
MLNAKALQALYSLVRLAHPIFHHLSAVVHSNRESSQLMMLSRRSHIQLTNGNAIHHGPTSVLLLSEKHRKRHEHELLNI